MNIMSAIERIERWYSSQCNGDWEHQNGVSIATTDNPGWYVTIDTKDTEIQQRQVHIKNEYFEIDSENGEVFGYANTGKLADLLNALADYLESKA